MREPATRLRLRHPLVSDETLVGEEERRRGKSPDALQHDEGSRKGRQGLRDCWYGDPLQMIPSGTRAKPSAYSCMATPSSLNERTQGWCWTESGKLQKTPNSAAQHSRRGRNWYCCAFCISELVQLVPRRVGGAEPNACFDCCCMAINSRRSMQRGAQSNCGRTGRCKSKATATTVCMISIW